MTTTAVNAQSHIYIDNPIPGVEDLTFEDPRLVRISGSCPFIERTYPGLFLEDQIDHELHDNSNQAVPIMYTQFQTEPVNRASGAQTAETLAYLRRARVFRNAAIATIGLASLETAFELAKYRVGLPNYRVAWLDAAHNIGADSFYYSSIAAAAAIQASGTDNLSTTRKKVSKITEEVVSPTVLIGGGLLSAYHASKDLLSRPFGNCVDLLRQYKPSNILPTLEALRPLEYFHTPTLAAIGNIVITGYILRSTRSSTYQIDKSAAEHARLDRFGAVSKAVAGGMNSTVDAGIGMLVGLKDVEIGLKYLIKSARERTLVSETHMHHGEHPSTHHHHEHICSLHDLAPLASQSHAHSGTHEHSHACLHEHQTLHSTTRAGRLVESVLNTVLPKSKHGKRRPSTIAVLSAALSVSLCAINNNEYSKLSSQLHSYEQDANANER